MKKKLLSLLLLGGLTLTAGAQNYHPFDGTFDNTWVDCVPWDSKNNSTAFGTEPEGWCVANVPNSSMPLVGSIVEGVSGNALQLTNVSVMGQSAPGYITLGTSWATAEVHGVKVAIGSEGVRNADGGSFGGILFSYHPDAVQLKYKRNASKGTERASVVAYTWCGTWSQANVPANTAVGVFGWGSATKTTMVDRDRNVLGKSTTLGGDVSNNNGELVAKTERYIEGSNSNWATLVAEFDYGSKKNVDNVTVEKMNIIISCTDYFADRSGIVSDNMLVIDDVELLYYHGLSTVNYNGVTKTIAYEDVNTVNVDFSDMEYDNAKAITYVRKGQGAKVVVGAYNEATAQVVVRVTAEDYDATLRPNQYTDYVLQFATPQSEPEIVSSTDYSDNLVVVINGENTLPQETTINVSKMSDGSYTLSLNDFMLVAGEDKLPVGNIVLEGLTATEENGTISFSTNQSILIQPGSTGSEEWFGPELGEVPIVMTAKVSGGKMKCEIDIDMTGSLGQVINVYFGVVNNLETEALPDAEGVHVVLNRTFQPGWSTVFLQYDVTMEELGAVKVMQFDRYDRENDVLKFTEVASGNMSGNYPYLVKFDAEKVNPFFANRRVWNTPGGRYSDIWSFMGTFTGIANMEGKYGVTANIDGSQYIRRGGKNASIKGTRAYFECSDDSRNVQQMRIQLDGENGATSIDGVQVLSGSFDIYNLQGIRVRTAATSLEGLTPGVYVVNGKKVMVK